MATGLLGQSALASATNTVSIPFQLVISPYYQLTF
jgi:hypothetical protein